MNQKSFISTDNYIQPTDSTIFSYKRGFFAELLLINDFLMNDSLGKNARFNKSLDLKNSSLVGYFKKIKILFLSTLYALIKLLTINGV